MKRSRLELAAAIAVCMFTASSCVHHSGNSVSLGLKRVAVNLAFRDATKAKPPTVQQVVETPQMVPSVALAVSALPVSDQPSRRTRQRPAAHSPRP